MLSFGDFMGIMRSFDFNLLGGESGESLRFYLSFVELFAESENFLKSFTGAEIETLSKNAKIDLSLANSFVESLFNNQMIVFEDKIYSIPILDSFFNKKEKRKKHNARMRKTMRKIRGKIKNPDVIIANSDNISDVIIANSDNISKIGENRFDNKKSVNVITNNDDNIIPDSPGMSINTDILKNREKSIKQNVIIANSDNISKNSFSVNQTDGNINKDNIIEDKSKNNKINKYKKEGEKNLEQNDVDEIRVITERLQSSQHFVNCFYEDSNEISILLKLFSLKTIILTIDKLEEWNKLKEVKPKNFYKTMRFWCEQNDKNTGNGQTTNGKKQKSKIDEEHVARNEYGYGSVKVPEEYLQEYERKRAEMKKKNEVPPQEVEKVDDKEFSNFITLMKGK